MSKGLNVPESNDDNNDYNEFYSNVISHINDSILDHTFKPIVANIVLEDNNQSS